MEATILFENSLNVGSPVATELETHTHSVGEPSGAFQVTRLGAKNLSSGRSQRTFTVGFLPSPKVKLKERSYFGGCDENFRKASQPPTPGPPSSFQSDTIFQPLAEQKLSQGSVFFQILGLSSSALGALHGIMHITEMFGSILNERKPDDISRKFIVRLHCFEVDYFVLTMCIKFLGGGNRGPKAKEFQPSQKPSVLGSPCGRLERAKKAVSLGVLTEGGGIGNWFLLLSEKIKIK